MTPFARLGRHPLVARWLGVAALASLLSGCFVRQMGRDLGDGLFDSVDNRSPPVVKGVAHNVGTGLREEILNDATRKELARTVDTVGDSARVQVEAIRDELAGAKTQAELQRVLEALLRTLEAQGQHTTQVLAVDVGEGLRTQVLGDATQAQLQRTVQGLGAQSQVEIGKLRDELLSARTDREARVILESAMDVLVEGTDRIRRQAHQELSWAERNSIASMIAMGAITMAVISFFFWQRQRYRRMVEVMAGQIRDLPDEREKEELMDRIRTMARAAGLERVVDFSFRGRRPPRKPPPGDAGQS